MKNKNKQLISWLTLSIVLVVAVLATTYILLINKSPEDRGTFGDMFGVANALFSGLAFAGIIITILLQRNELQLQRRELRDTRKEFKLQNQTMKTQLFENTFFNMVALHNQIVNDIYEDGIDIQRFKGGELPIPLRGRNAFRYWLTVLNGYLKKESNFIELYNTIYTIKKSDLGHYFRNLYRIVKMIDEHPFQALDEIAPEIKDPQERMEFINSMNFRVAYEYTSIVRAQLSNSELLLLFYNGLSEKGKNFKSYIERYSLLDNLDKSEVINSEWLKNYHDSAYASSKNNYLKKFVQEVSNNNTNRV